MAGRPRSKPAENLRAFLKVGFYGDTGTGKTATALLLAEYLAKREGKRVMYISTEGSANFYAKAIPERKFHPEKFDFDIEPTRDIVWVRDFLGEIDDEIYGVVVIDSISHLWDSAQELYTGPKTSKGTNPIHAWAIIKKPWRQMMDRGENGKFHFIICGRQANVWDTSSGEWLDKGTRMRAEKEAGYEPDITCKMIQEVSKGEHGKNEFRIDMYVEKDRSSILMGKTIPWPNGETFAPVYDVLSDSHGVMQTVEEAAAAGADRLEAEIVAREAERQNLYDTIRRAIIEAPDKPKLVAAWSLTKGKKTALGDEMYEGLKALRDGRNTEIMERTTAVRAAEEEK